MSFADAKARTSFVPTLFAVLHGSADQPPPLSFRYEGKRQQRAERRERSLGDCCMGILFKG